jgi:hypothetical protein
MIIITALKMPEQYLSQPLPCHLPKLNRMWQAQTSSHLRHGTFTFRGLASLPAFPFDLHPTLLLLLENFPQNIFSFPFSLHSLPLCDHFFNLHSISSPLYIFTSPAPRLRASYDISVSFFVLLSSYSISFFGLFISAHDSSRHNAITQYLSGPATQFTHGSSIKALQNRQATSCNNKRRISPN